MFTQIILRAQDARVMPSNDWTIWSIWEKQKELNNKAEKFLFVSSASAIANDRPESEQNPERANQFRSEVFIQALRVYGVEV